MAITEHIIHPFISALGWTLLHSLWQIAIIAILWRISLGIAAKSPAALRHNLSFWAMLAIPLSFSFTFIRQWRLYNKANEIVSLEFSNTQWLPTSGNQAFFLLEKAQPGFLQHYEAYTHYVFWIYLIGLTIFSVIGITGSIRSFRLKRSGILPLPNDWHEQALRCLKKVGLNTPISIKLSSGADIPMVLGVIRPVVLLPVAMLTSMTTEQIESVILHEMYHIRKKDHWINALQIFLETLFFYHPATWWIGNTLKKEREQRVDEWVVEATGTPMEYARALVNIEEKRSNRAPQPALAATQSHNKLLIRIKHFMTMKTRKLHPGQKIAAFAAILAAFVSVAWIHPGQTTQDQPNRKEPISLDAPLQPRFDISLLTKEEVAFDEPPALSVENETPKAIHLDNGRIIPWEELNTQDRKELEKAIAETRLKIEQLNRELIEKFQSEDFQKEMREISAAYQQAMKELQDTFQSEAFQKEMQKVSKEFQSSIDSLQQEFRTEEFQQQMRQMGEEFRKAMEEMRETFQQEEFQQQMREVGEEFRKAMEEVRKAFQQEDFQKEINQAMEELRKAMQELRKIDMK